VASEELVPITESGSRAPIAVQGLSRWPGPPCKAENLSAFGYPKRKQKIRLSLRILQTVVSSSKRDQLPPQRKLRQKWGGHVHPSQPRGDAPARVIIIIIIDYAISETKTP